MCVMVVSAACIRQNYLLYLVLQDTFSRPQAEIFASLFHTSFLNLLKQSHYSKVYFLGESPELAQWPNKALSVSQGSPECSGGCHKNKRYLILTPLCISTSNSGKHSSSSGISARYKKQAHKSPQHRLTSKERQKAPLLLSHTQGRFQLLHSGSAHAQSIKCHYGSAPHSHSQHSLELCLLSSQGLPQKFSLMAIFCHFLLELTLGVWVADIRSCLPLIGYQTPNLLLAGSVP